MSKQGGDQEGQDQPAEEANQEAMSKRTPPPKGPSLKPLKAQAATAFERFTERAREALSLARDEAKRFNHTFIGTEHILLGLLREGEGVAALVLTRMGVGLDAVRDEVERIIGRADRMIVGADRMIVGDFGLTPRAKKVMELAVDDARRNRQSHVGTEHLLLGLVREGGGIAADVLKQFGVTLEVVRLQVVEVLGAGGRAAEPVGPRANVITCRVDDRDLDAIDALVEAGIRSTRSDAASWLISAGIDAHRELFERVYATVAEIRNLRTEARAIARQLAVREQASKDVEEAMAVHRTIARQQAARAQEPAPPESGEPPAAGEEPPAAGG